MVAGHWSDGLHTVYELEVFEKRYVACFPEFLSEPSPSRTCAITPRSNDCETVSPIRRYLIFLAAHCRR